ncbi:MAG: MBL fold metallo-hydrolase [Chloroflexi bacterium]|nr:MBL fold metallo-hydrolase [Chloroflexota bacterium]
MQIELIVTGPIQENCYIVMDEATHAAIIVDPGDDAPEIIAAVSRMGAQPTAIVNTHCHFDHVGAVEAVRRAYGIPFYIHPKDQAMLERASESAARFGMPMEQPRVDRFIREGETVPVGAHSLAVRFTPGHCPGHVILVGDGFALAGDVLFAGSVGRTDLPGTSWTELANSIQNQVLTLPDDTVVYPGHGPHTTIGRERLTNPFLQGL